MRSHGWVLMCWLIVMGWAHADSSCRPKNDRALIIGHSFKLDWFTTFRMKNSARLLGYQIQFKDLRTFANTTQALLSVDGVIVPGGADIDPSYYDKANLPAEVSAEISKFRRFYKTSAEGRERDPYEYQLYQTYYQQAALASLPLLGVCRGMQMMAVAKGVPLVIDIRAELGIKNRYNRFDRFHVSDATSIMATLFPAGNALGFKFHHQNPRLTYLQRYPERHPDLRVTATSFNDRLLEAIELSDRPALGIQFHPEKSFPTLKHRIYKWLLTNACERSHQRDSL